ncbi:DUF4429 domain-containing protein [Streptomyces sp. NPDC001407]|uniref:DUF4429 domain-containing protein n=1 Tax=unclassified Streptomyces TaxID=2593676 RepID=UPI0033ED6AE9
MYAEGLSGQVAFDGQFVTITRRGFRARVLVGKGEKRIPLHQVSAVQWKPAGPVVNGFVQFSLAGGNERQSAFGTQTRDAARDENSIVFTHKQQPAFDHLRTAVEAALAAMAGGMPSVASPAADVVTQLDTLARLLASGALTQQEFDQQKRRLLNS